METFGSQVLKKRILKLELYYILTTLCVHICILYLYCENVKFQ